MTGPSSTQIVSVSLALAGEQTARIDTNHAGTPQARLHLLWGALMLTLTSPAQTGYSLDVWQRAARAATALPMTLRDRRPLSGMDPRLNTPGVVTTMYGLPVWTVDAVAARITPNRHHVPQHVTVRIGGLTWQCFDQTATRSACGIFARAHRIAPALFGA